MTNLSWLVSWEPFSAEVVLVSLFLPIGSTGGTDIIAAIVNKYRDITLGRVILMCDLVIISSSYFVLHDWEKVVYGLCCLVYIQLCLGSR